LWEHTAVIKAALAGGDGVVFGPADGVQRRRV